MRKKLTQAPPPRKTRPVRAERLMIVIHPAMAPGNIAVEALDQVTGAMYVTTHPTIRAAASAAYARIVKGWAR